MRTCVKSAYVFPLVRALVVRSASPIEYGTRYLTTIRTWQNAKKKLTYRTRFFDFRRRASGLVEPPRYRFILEHGVVKSIVPDSSDRTLLPPSRLFVQ